MRYYELTITNPLTQNVWRPTTTGLGLSQLPGGSTFTSYVGGQTLPGALNIEFDIPVYPFAQPQGKAIIRVWGVGLPMIGQATKLAFQNFSLRAGMQSGLPLANPKQRGLIVQGQIFQAFGNWQGTEQTLDLVVYPGCAGAGQNISFSWPAKTPLAPALKAALSAAFPTFSVNINIEGNLITSEDQKGHYPSLAEFADMILQLTQQIGQPSFNTPGLTYPGVNITVSGSTINAYDGRGSVATKITAIAFQDLIGQPTWISPLTVNFKTVLRADISVGDAIRFPQGIRAPYALTSAAAAAPNAPASSQTAFQGVFTVTEVHHFANFRQPDAESWNTTFSAVSVLNS